MLLPARHLLTVTLYRVQFRKKSQHFQLRLQGNAIRLVQFCVDLNFLTSRATASTQATFRGKLSAGIRQHSSHAILTPLFLRISDSSSLQTALYRVGQISSIMKQFWESKDVSSDHSDDRWPDYGLIQTPGSDNDCGVAGGHQLTLLQL
jgi:hypothetical protein